MERVLPIFQIRDYHVDDKPALINLIKLNTPMYFGVHEEADFSYFLDHETEFYYVLLVNQQIVGCGGVNFSEDGAIGILSWDIIHPDYQRKSLGSQLLKYRLEKLKSIKDVKVITVRTSQLVDQFYAQHGFKLQEVQKDYWATGIDLYKMVYIK